MQAITVRELQEKTDEWLGYVKSHGEILVTDQGRAIAKLVPWTEEEERPYFANRKPSPAFQRLMDAGELCGGRDSTETISEDRDR
jgi:antitoxin (DNA-binding transcriptional repressor) of toxin-antitoxin stability system